MTAIKGSDGLWHVVDDTGAVISKHETHSRAWRAIDRLNHEALNRSEAVSDWIASQILRGPA